MDDFRLYPADEAELLALGKHLKTAREQAALSQRALARLAYVSQSTVCRTENGKMPTLRLQRYARMLAAAHGQFRRRW